MLFYIWLEDVIFVLDCGMKYFLCDVVFGKFRVMVEVVKLLRVEFGGD